MAEPCTTDAVVQTKRSGRIVVISVTGVTRKLAATIKSQLITQLGKLAEISDKQPDAANIIDLTCKVNASSGRRADSAVSDFDQKAKRLIRQTIEAHRVAQSQQGQDAPATRDRSGQHRAVARPDQGRRQGQRDPRHRVLVRR